MIKIVLSAVFFCFLAVTVPISYGADVCANLNKTVCCGKLNSTDQKTRLCQYVVCNGTEACKPAGEEQFCPVGSNVTSLDTCPNTTATTAHTPTGTTQNKTGSTAAPPKTSTPAPGTGTTQTQDTCTGKNQTECCAMQNAKNVSLCQYMLCKDNATGVSACFNKSKTVAEICGVAPATGEDQCSSTTPATTPAPTPTSTNRTVTTQGPKCGDKTDNTSCCAFKMGNVSCEWVNCFDAKAPKKVHTGCHTQGENLTNVCVKDTIANLCKGSTSTSAPAPSTSTPKPTGGAQPSTGDKDQGRHFDGASFIGGIVLCAGLVAIGFFGLKFYRARTERNYHTLH